MNVKSQKTARGVDDTAQAYVFRRLREGAVIAAGVIAIYLFLALVSYDRADPGWRYTGIDGDVSNVVGLSGAWTADVLYFVFGYLAFVFPVAIAAQAWQMLSTWQLEQTEDWKIKGFRFACFVISLVAACAIAELHFYEMGNLLRQGSGGVLGSEVVSTLVPLFNYVGSTLLLLALLLFGLTVALDISWIRVVDGTGARVIQLGSHLQRNWLRFQEQHEEKARVKQQTEERREKIVKQIEKKQTRPAVTIEATLPAPQISERVEKEKQGTLFKTTAIDGLPALHLLDPKEPGNDRGYSTDDLEAMSRLLELKLRDYNVEAEVVSVLPGPVVTRFEIQPAAGIKVSRITGLVKDLARSLAVISVRVVEVIPGKSVVGIEIPNVDRQMVKLSEVLTSKTYENFSSPLSLALGHTISGEPVVVDLARMPHLLVAGTTGSGKSVGLNAMILSILFKASPEDVRLIMVDPKMLELAVYEGIPHLLTPVVTDMKDAANALRWCVAEMERRYRLMAALGVRNLGGFNRKVKEAAKQGEPILDPLWQPL